MKAIEKEKKIGRWKELMVEELTGIFKAKPDFYISDYIGLKADELNKLRATLKKYSARYLIVKNAMIKIALGNAGLKELAKRITGGTGIAFGGDDPVAALKAMAKFGRAHEPFKLKCGYLDGDILDGNKITYLASLPKKDELISKFVYAIKSPLCGLAGVLSNTLKSILYALQAIKDIKGEHE